MPAFPLHGWMPDSYRRRRCRPRRSSPPCPRRWALTASSGRAADDARRCRPFQTTMLVLAIASILYGSAMAFTKTDLRLVLGFSSVAQLGFITAGIFA